MARAGDETEDTYRFHLPPRPELEVFSSAMLRCYQLGSVRQAF